MKKCNNCQSTSMIQSKLMLGFSGSHAFALEPKKGFWVKKGIIPQVWVCEKCKNLMFFLANESDFDKIIKLRG